MQAMPATTERSLRMPTSLTLPISDAAAVRVIPLSVPRPRTVYAGGHRTDRPVTNDLGVPLMRMDAVIAAPGIGVVAGVVDIPEPAAAGIVPAVDFDHALVGVGTGTITVGGQSENIQLRVTVILDGVAPARPGRGE